MKKNILIFPCGSEIGLEIHRSLKYSKDFNLIGGSSVDDHGKFVYKNYIGNLPFIDEKIFISKLNKEIVKNKIDYIFPAHDSVLLKLSQNREKIKAIIIASDSNTCEICRSKRRTYETFKKIIKTPKIFNKNEKINFPAFLKPEIGQGSVGTQKVNTLEELINTIKKNPSLMILEYLPGKEYTIDCFTDRHGKLVFTEGRQRIRISNGISVNSKTINNPEFLKIAKKINKILKLRGVWFFQLKEDINGELSLLEIEPRVAGTMALCRVKGVNLPMLTLYDFMNLDVSIINNRFSVEIDRALEAKYKNNLKYTHIYIDLDDTLILDKTVNQELMCFIYQSLNENKKIYLITKHKKNVKKTLVKYKISKDIFSKIIKVKKEEEKWDFIKNKKSIFIDDSYLERKKISQKLNIPVFDLDSIECLLK